MCLYSLIYASRWGQVRQLDRVVSEETKSVPPAVYPPVRGAALRATHERASSLRRIRSNRFNHTLFPPPLILDGIP